MCSLQFCFGVYSVDSYWKALSTTIENPESGSCEYILVDDMNLWTDAEAAHKWSVQISEPAGSCSACWVPGNENPFSFFVHAKGTHVRVHVSGKIASDCESDTCATDVRFVDLENNLLVNITSCVARNIRTS